MIGCKDNIEPLWMGLQTLLGDAQTTSIARIWMDGIPVSIERLKRRCPARHQRRYLPYLECKYPLPTPDSRTPIPHTYSLLPYSPTLPPFTPYSPTTFYRGEIPREYVTLPLRKDMLRCRSGPTASLLGNEWATIYKERKIEALVDRKKEPCFQEEIGEES